MVTIILHGKGSGAQRKLKEVKIHMEVKKNED